MCLTHRELFAPVPVLSDEFGVRGRLLSFFQQPSSPSEMAVSIEGKRGALFLLQHLSVMLNGRLILFPSWNVSFIPTTFAGLRNLYMLCSFLPRAPDFFLVFLCAQQSPRSLQLPSR